MREKIEQILPIVLILFSLLYLLSIILLNNKIFTERFDPQLFKKKYEQSQWSQSQNVAPAKAYDEWALKNGYQGWSDYQDHAREKNIDIKVTQKNILDKIAKKGISDTDLYTYVGYEYIKGKNPVLLNPEHPPLGKYLIGLSIVLFKNQNTILLLSSFLILTIVFILVYYSSKSLLASSIAVFLTAINSLFIDQIIHGPQLDIFQLLFLVPLFLFLYLYEVKKNNYYLIFAGVTLGLLISIKTFTSYFLIFNLWLFLYWLFQKKKIINKITSYILINIIAFIVFTITYSVYFFQGNDLRKFLGVQKYIFLFYQHSGINVFQYFGNYLRLMFTGSWVFWSQGNPISFYKHWNIFWPIIFILGLIAGYRLIKNNYLKKNQLILSLLAFLIVYNIFLFIFPIFPRYLLLLFVPLNILISLWLTSKQI